MSAAPNTSSSLSLDDIQIIDVDAHITEPHDLWTGRASAARCLAVRRVRLARHRDGVRQHLHAFGIDDQPGGGADSLQAGRPVPPLPSGDPIPFIRSIRSSGRLRA